MKKFTVPGWWSGEQFMMKAALCLQDEIYITIYTDIEGYLKFFSVEASRLRLPSIIDYNYLLTGAVLTLEALKKKFHVSLKTQAERMRAFLCYGLPETKNRIAIIDDSLETYNPTGSTAIVKELFTKDFALARRALTRRMFQEFERTEDALQVLTFYFDRFTPGEKLILFWGRKSGAKTGVSRFLDTNEVMLAQMLKTAHAQFSDRRVVLLGDPLDSDIMEVDLSGSLSLFEYWTYRDFPKSTGLVAQMYFLYLLSQNNDVVSVGQESGVLEIPHLMGMPTIYMENNHLAPLKGLRWQGFAERITLDISPTDLQQEIYKLRGAADKLKGLSGKRLHDPRDAIRALYKEAAQCRTQLTTALETRKIGGSVRDKVRRTLEEVEGELRHLEGENEVIEVDKSGKLVVKPPVEVTEEKLADLQFRIQECQIKLGVITNDNAGKIVADRARALRRRMESAGILRQQANQRVLDNSEMAGKRAFNNRIQVVNLMPTLKRLTTTTATETWAQKLFIFRHIIKWIRRGASLLTSSFRETQPLSMSQELVISLSGNLTRALIVECGREAEAAGSEEQKNAWWLIMHTWYSTIRYEVFTGTTTEGNRLIALMIIHLRAYALTSKQVASFASLVREVTAYGIHAQPLKTKFAFIKVRSPDQKPTSFKEVHQQPQDLRRLKRSNSEGDFSTLLSLSGLPGKRKQTVIQGRPRSGSVTDTDLQQSFPMLRSDHILPRVSFEDKKKIRKLLGDRSLTELFEKKRATIDCNGKVFRVGDAGGKAGDCMYETVLHLLRAKLHTLFGRHIDAGTLRRFVAFFEMLLGISRAHALGVARGAWGTVEEDLRFIAGMFNVRFVVLGIGTSGDILQIDEVGTGDTFYLLNTWGVHFQPLSPMD